MRRALALLLVFILVCASAALAEDYRNRQVDFCEEYVSLRQTPDTSSAVVDEVYIGEVVAAYRFNSKFSHCFYNGKNGFILNKYLRDEITVCWEPFEFFIANCENYVSLREFPMAGSEAIARLPLDTPVTVVYHDDSYDPEAFVYIITETEGGGYVQWKYLDRPYIEGYQ